MQAREEIDSCILRERERESREYWAHKSSSFMLDKEAEAVGEEFPAAAPPLLGELFKLVLLRLFDWL